MGEADLHAEAFDANVLPTANALNSFCKNKYCYTFFKRLFDLVTSLVGILVLMPLIVLIAVVIKIESPGPVFFVQARVGKGLIFFNIFKFRTMYADSIPIPMYVNNPETNEMRRPSIKEDARITKFGAILRSLSLDELPQLLNILLGEMSFIGPRPLTIQESLNVPTEAICRYAVKPGLSGLAQIRNRSAMHSESRFAGDIEYVLKNSTLSLLWLFSQRGIWE